MTKPLRDIPDRATVMVDTNVVIYSLFPQGRYHQMCKDLLMLSAVNLTLITPARAMGDLAGQIYVFFSLTVAAAEVAVGLALVVAIYRSLGRADVDDVSVLHG